MTRIARTRTGLAAAARSVAAISLALLAATAAAAPASPPAPDDVPEIAGTWNFRVLLDGKPIGTHRFTLRGDGAQRELKSEAAFDVRLLGFTAYRYRHTATEHWQDDCLAALTAKTDDDGELSSVQARKEGDVLSVTSPRGTERLEGCVMSFAYWRASMLQQKRLLNAQTGRYEPVKIEVLGNTRIEAQGKTVDARHFRLTGPEQPVELWYSPQGDWLGLESTVSNGKRKLTYRRE